MGVSNDNDNCPLKGQCYIRNQVAHCLKITENVSFNFASLKLSSQKFIENAKNRQLNLWSNYYQTGQS